MYMINPSLMCDTHIVAEHTIIHKFNLSIILHKSINPRFKLFCEPMSIRDRHEELVQHMDNRGIHHDTDLKYQPDISVGNYAKLRVEKAHALVHLNGVCSKCRTKIQDFVTSGKSADKSIEQGYY